MVIFVEWIGFKSQTDILFYVNYTTNWAIIVVVVVLNCCFNFVYMQSINVHFTRPQLTLYGLGGERGCK